jgi:4a-hydroxytetrahydrobiopterin dehydratase
MTHLTQKHCEPCEGNIQSFNRKEAENYIKETPGWTLDGEAKSIVREYLTKNFLAAVTLVNRIAIIAEEENHHPDFHLTGYRKLKVVLTTHAIHGLSKNDFILAAKINELPVELKIQRSV